MSRSIHRFLYLLCLSISCPGIGLAACSEDIQPEPEPGDPGGSVAITNLAEGDTSVSVFVVPEATVTGSVTASAIEAASVTLTDSLGLLVKGELAFDAASKTIRFLPTTPLFYGQTYHFRVSGLATTSGKPVPATEVTFTTFYNPAFRLISYGSDEAGATAEVVSYREDTFDGHRATLTTQYSESGDDGAWFTRDDVIASYTQNSFDGDGKRVQAVVYSAPGPDGVWMNEDDVQSRLIVRTFDEAGRVSRETAFNKPGPDGQWGTSDDVTGKVTRFEFDARGRWLRMLILIGAGPDGVWETADDLFIYNGQLYEDDFSNSETMFVSYGGPGEDQEWLTEDDVMASYEKNDGVRTIRRGVGADGKPFTSDDEMVGYLLYRYAASQLDLGAATYGAPGADGEWFTADDELESAYRTEYDEKTGSRTRVLYFSNAGPDGIWDSGDELPTLANEFRVDL